MPVTGVPAIWLRTGIAITAVGQVSSAWGQDATPQPSEPAAAAEESAEEPPAQSEEEILVVADPAERTSIDRTTYVVRDNAEAGTSSTLDLLGRIPTVDVTPAGQVRLLGRSGVRILIDGNEVADPQTALRNLQGSQVARIEVITNPSAQFSARGTGGIINIITRRSFASGLGGSLTANAGSFGAYELKASPTWSRGRLSLSGSLGAARGGTPSEIVRERRSEPDGGPVSESIERGTTRSRNESLTGNATATYRPTEKQSISVTAMGIEADGRLSRISEISDTGAGSSFTQTSSGRTDVAFRDVSIDYRREGQRQGETLTLSAKRSSVRFLSDTAFSTDSEAGETGEFRVRSDYSNTVTTLKVDYLRPSGTHRRLSLGGAVQRTSDGQFSQFGGQTPFGADVIPASFTTQGSWLEMAAYVTYQLPLLGGIALAGLRVEDRNFRLADAQVRAPGGTHLFPSLHLERGLAEGLTANLSYSRRIAWPGIAELNPALRFSDPTTASAGNPFLRPEITDSFEAKLKARQSRQDIELTVFFRRTRDLRSSLGELDDGVLVTRPVNLGERTSRGANLSVQGPLGGGFRYSLSGNLADQTISGNDSGLDFAPAGVQYVGSAQLEYRDGAEGRRGADRVEIRARYRGPTDLGLLRISSFASVDASWSHAFTDRLSGVLTLSDLLGPTTFRITSFADGTISRETTRTTGPRVTVSLTYSLSPPQQR